MIDHALASLKSRYRVQQRDIGDYAEIKKAGMHFSIRSYWIDGVGGLSAVSMSAMLGLMRMETLVLSPLDLDAPLFSFDRIRAAGNDTLLLELYDTQLAPIDLDALDAVKAGSSDLPDHALGEHWYDPLKLSPSLSKRGKRMDAAYAPLCREYWDAYLALLATAPACDREEKRSRIRAYTDGLLQNGGPSTDQFKKLIGEAQTRELFTRFIFFSEE